MTMEKWGRRGVSSRERMLRLRLQPSSNEGLSPPGRGCNTSPDRYHRPSERRLFWAAGVVAGALLLAFAS